ncbi:MAG: hypothetical protein ACLP00_13300 [Terracidiphilus sp.]
MSVVAGVSLLDGVLIGADCRITIQCAGGTTYRDTVQKLLPIGTHTVIGFVGWVPTAVKLLQTMLKARGTRQGAIELKHWLPRFFKDQYPKIPDRRPVSFLVASVVPNRPNIVPKAEIAKAVSDAVHSRPTGGINTISRSFLDVLNVPTTNVSVTGSGEGHLYAMHPPNFMPSNYRPMQSVAIGSGQKMQEQILEVSDQIHFGTHGDNVDVTWFGRSLNHYLRVSDETTVSTMFTMIKITAKNGMQCFGRKTVELKSGGSAYELSFEGRRNRWVQRNLTTGQAIELLLPWEVDNKETRDHRFDGLRPKPMPKSK